MAHPCKKSIAAAGLAAVVRYACATDPGLGPELSAGHAGDGGSRLNVHVPQTLFRPEGYRHLEAKFGIPPNAGSIAQNVYYADSNLCSEKVDNRKGYPRRPIDETGKMEPWPSPFILMVDDGGCPYVQKVRNAQHAGAAGVVIADNKCMCSDRECMEASGQDSSNLDCRTEMSVLANDGSAGDISVPSFFMYKKDADKIKEELLADRMVQIEMQWSVTKSVHSVKYDLWTSPSDEMSKDFQTEFKTAVQALGDRAQFTPHMYIYDGIKEGCQIRGADQCFTMCTNNGRYCAKDPDMDIWSGVSGADVIKESLRRICIWKNYGESDGLGVKWWHYVEEFTKLCDVPENFAEESCVAKAYKHAKIDKKLIDECMLDSGGLENDVPNTYLDAEISERVEQGVVVVPTTFINTAALHGDLSTPNVFNAICEAYIEGKQPSLCTECSTCSDIGKCVEQKRCMDNSAVVYTNLFVASVFFVCLTIGGLGFYYYKKTQAKVRDDVRSILLEYMPLEDLEA